MFAVRVAVDIDRQFLTDLKQMSPIIRYRVFDAAKGPIAETVQKELVAATEDSPVAVVHPFSFATDKSMQWYFWALRTGQLEGQEYDGEDGTYVRTGNLASGWTTAVDARANEFFLSATNEALGGKEHEPFSQAVLGPLPVPGHEEAGWPEWLDEEADSLSLTVEGMLLDALDEAMQHFEEL